MEEDKPHQDEAQQPQQPAESAAEGVPEFVDQAETAFIAEAPSGHKRATVLVVAGLLIFAGAAIYMMRLKTGPQTAAASNPDALNANTTIKKAITDGGKDVKQMQELLKVTEKWRQLFLRYPFHRQVKVEELQTNPFLFAKEKPTGPTKDDEAERLEREKREFAQQIGKFKVQSIMVSGKVRSCMINNINCVEGQQIDGVTIAKISRDGVDLRKGRYGTTLRMQR